MTYRTPEDCPIPRIFSDRTIESILVAYILRFSSFSQRDVESRIQIRFLFNLFVQQQIPAPLFFGLCENFDASIALQARILGQALIDPRSMIAASGQGQTWTDQETLLLISLVVLNLSNSISEMLPERSPEACRARIKRVVQELQSADMFSDLPRDRDRACSLTFSTVFDVKGARQARKLRQRRMQAAVMRSKKKMRRRILNLKTSNMRLKKSLVNLQQTLDEFEHSLQENSGLGEIDSKSHLQERHVDIPFPHLLDELSSLLGVSDRRQRRYSKEALSFSELIRLTSGRGYKLIRQVLPLPSESCLRLHFQDEISNTKSLISEKDRLSEHIFKPFTDSFEPGEPITIGVDAFAFRTFYEGGTMRGAHGQQFSNGFVFMQIPLNADRKVKVIHVLKKKSGNFDSSIDNVFQLIANQYHELGLRCWFKATDGGRYMNQEHEYFFKQYIEQNRSSYELLVSSTYQLLLDSDVIIPISDPLHSAKNLRGKLLDHNVVVRIDDDPANELPSVTADSLEKILKLGLSLTDSSQLGRMRDIYVTEIFQFRNVCLLLKSKRYDAAYLLLPFSCLFTLLYAANLSNNARFSLANLAYVAVDKLFSEAEAAVGAKIGVTYRYSKSSKAITCAEPAYFKRMMHTLIAYGIALSYGPRHLRLDAIGTHLLENAIGIARSTSNSTEYPRILTAFANAEIRKDLARDLDVELYVSKRINDGGAKVMTLSESGLSWPEGWNPISIGEMFYKSCKRDFSEQEKEELEQFLPCFEEYIANIEIKTLSHPSPVSNALIMQRNMCFSHSSQTESLSTPPIPS